jgi:hypothetical protein
MAKLTQGPIRNVGVRTSGPNRVVNPAGAAQIGAHLGNHSERGSTGGNPATPLYGGRALNPTPMGNQIAASTKSGPGGSRTIYKAGYQCQYGAAVQGPSRPARDILIEYGKDYHSKGSRR